MEEKKCPKCKKVGKYIAVDKKYCKNCFLDLIEQKIRRNLRQYEIKKDSKLYTKDAIGKYAIQHIINIPTKIAKSPKTADYTISTETLNDQNESFLKEFLETKKQPRKKTRAIMLFRNISKSELQQYCNIREIEYNPTHSDIDAAIDNFESKYPGTRTAIASSRSKLQKEKK